MKEFVNHYWKDVFDYVKAAVVILLAKVTVNDVASWLSLCYIGMKTYYLYRDNRKEKTKVVDTVIANTIENINPRFNPITSLVGVLLIVIAIGMFIVPMIYEVKSELNYWIPASIGLLGISLLLIPDDVKGALKKLLNRKSESL